MSFLDPNLAGNKLYDTNKVWDLISKIRQRAHNATDNKPLATQLHPNDPYNRIHPE